MRNLLPAIFFIVAIMLFSGAHALTISPASAKITRSQGTFELAVINTENADMPVSIGLGNFEGAAVVSQQNITVPAQGSTMVKIIFYENVCRQGTICVSSGGGGETQIGTAIRVCMSADVVTTKSGRKDTTCGDAKMTPAVVNSLIGLFEQAKLKLDSQIEYLKFACIEYSKSSEFNRLASEGDSAISDAKSALQKGDLFVAQSLVVRANESLESAQKLLPKISEIFNASKEYAETTESAERNIESLGIENPALKAEAGELAGKLRIGRGVKVFRVIDKINGADYFVTNIGIDIVNRDRKALPEIKVSEFFSPSIIKKASEFSTKSSFSVIREFPLAVQFNVPEIRLDGAGKISYCIKSRIGTEEFELLLAPIATYATIPAMKSTACVVDADCDDGNVCTKNSCSGGLCLAMPVPEGTACGEGKACAAGACLKIGQASVAVEAKSALPLPPIEVMLLAVGIGIFLMLFVIVVLILRKSSPAGKKPETEKPKKPKPAEKKGKKK